MIDHSSCHQNILDCLFDVHVLSRTAIAQAAVDINVNKQSPTSVIENSVKGTMSSGYLCGLGYVRTGRVSLRTGRVSVRTGRGSVA